MGIGPVCTDCFCKGLDVIEHAHEGGYVCARLIASCPGPVWLLGTVVRSIEAVA